MIVGTTLRIFFPLHSSIDLVTKKSYEIYITTVSLLARIMLMPKSSNDLS